MQRSRNVTVRSAVGRLSRDSRIRHGLYARFQEGLPDGGQVGGLGDQSIVHADHGELAGDAYP